MKTFSQFLLEATDPKGPIKKYMSPEEIAKKHKISGDTLETELKLGIKVESEHTGDKRMARMIALQHLEELPNYYSKLKKMEKVNESKSGDSSLRDWFTKSRASDGTPGWVQLGGKYAGKPCAKQPGQTTKPKCGSSKMKAALSDDEEQKAFERKNRQDPNPDREGKAKMVATEGRIAWHDPKNPNPSGYTPKEKSEAKRKQLGVDDPDKMSFEKGGPGEKEYARYGNISAAQEKMKKRGNQPKGKKHEFKKNPFWKKDTGQVRREIMGTNVPKSKESFYPSNVSKAKSRNEEFLGVNEEKDACYSKVKSRYKVWPSAYASGALVKCRKVGAKNWGNKTRKESYDYSNWREEFKATEYEFFDVIKPEPLKSSSVTENYTRIQSRGTTYSILLNWRGKNLGVQMFFPQFTRPSKEQVTFEVSKIYPGAIVLSFNPSTKDPTKPLLFTGDLNGPK